MNQTSNQIGRNMKSITIHGIDEDLEKLIKYRARLEGLSVNKSLKKILEEALGVKPGGKDSHRGDFEEFCGIWQDEELSEFENSTKELRQIDPGDWE